MAIEFKKASKDKLKLRLALEGVTGCGKSYSSLRLASGLISPGQKILVIDTERGSGKVYSDYFDYDVYEINPPYNPNFLIEVMKEAEKAGYHVIIIDSISHFWADEGGVLKIVEAHAEGSASKNRYNAWSKGTDIQDKMVNTMLGLNCHVIATMRSKMGHEQYKDEKGKPHVKKLGLAPIQRDTLEYEFTIILNIDQETHLASTEGGKDRTKLFDGQPPFLITEDMGKQLLNWLNKSSSNAPVATVSPSTKASPARQQDDVPPAIAEEKAIREMDYGSRVAKLRACDNLPHLDNTYKKYSLGLDDGEAFNFESERDLCASKIREAFKTKPAPSKNEAVNPETESTALRSKIFALVNERKIAGKLPKLCVDVSGDAKINHPNKMSLELLHDLLTVLEGK